jgi:nucleoside-diphosphate-sugar epimerase
MAPGACAGEGGSAIRGLTLYQYAMTALPSRRVLVTGGAGFVGASCSCRRAACAGSLAWSAWRSARRRRATSSPTVRDLIHVDDAVDRWIDGHEAAIVAAL